jgi:hypothetical protein
MAVMMAGGRTMMHPVSHDELLFSSVNLISFCI